MPRARIIATGHYVPDRVVTNDDLAEICNTSDQWIRERTGIEERRFVADGQTTSDLGQRASLQALEAAGLQPSDIDCIIFATLSPDYCFPGAGCLMQAKLGMPGIPAFDLRNQCSGFLYGLQMADAFIRTGTYERILLVGAEVHSTGLDLSERGRQVSVLFGDGAGAVIIAADDTDDHGVIISRLGADGSHATDLWCEGPGSARTPSRITPEMLEEGIQYPQMKGRVVFKHAVQRMRAALSEVLHDTGHTLDDLQLLIPHQANLRISESLARMLPLSEDRIFNNIQRYGNTTAGSIPIALDECVRAGRLQQNDLVALVSFGSGFTWGAALVRW